MVLPVKSVDNGDAMKKLKLFSEHFFNHFINLVVMYGVHLGHGPMGVVDNHSINISGVIINSPTSTLNSVSQRLCDLAKMFGIYIIKDRSTITDVGNFIKTANITSPTAEFLINASRQIFLSYERLLMSLKDNELPTYAKEAAEKILKFYVNPSTLTDQMITTAVTCKETDDINIVQCCFGDLFSLLFQPPTDTAKNKIAKYFSKAGIYYDKKIYTKEGLNVKKYYYRRLCDTETMHTIQQEYYHLAVNQSDKYEYVLFPEHKDQQMNDLREHMETRNVTDFNLRNDLEVIEKKIIDEIKSIKKIYHLKLMENLIDSLDGIKNRIRCTHSTSTSNTGIPTANSNTTDAGSSCGTIKNNVTSNKIGRVEQKVKRAKGLFDNTFSSNKIEQIYQHIEGDE